MNIIFFLAFIAFGFAFISLGLTLIEQWRARRDDKSIVRGTFYYFHCWVGGILGIGDVVCGIAAFIMAILVLVSP